MIPMGSSTKYGKQLSSMAVLVVDIPLSSHIIAYHGYPSVISKIGKGCSFSCRCTSDSPGMSRSHRFVLCAVRCVASSFPGVLSHWGTETTVVATRRPIWSSQPPRRLSQRLFFCLPVTRNQRKNRKRAGTMMRSLTDLGEPKFHTDIRRIPK